jgi:D-glycero-alpha-D-manno-heptose 1-phosphate guanylyltransferase
VREAIILAGGLGTRLRSEVPDLPKCMAPVAGRPFLFHVINHLRSQGIERFIFSVGYKSEIIENWLHDQYSSLDYVLAVEPGPLGTGGAIRFALDQCREENVLIANGDTLFLVNLEQLENMHDKNRADCTIALKPMVDFDRYGAVQTSEAGKITAFREKAHYDSGLINGGIYLLSRPAFQSLVFPEKFSFENDYLEKLNANVYGYAEDAYFIDIGIPEDFRRANTELQHPLPDLTKISKEWTLFIDRDGVINPEKKEDYIRNRGEFHFYEGVPAALKTCSEKFGQIIIVSNQRGVGKGLMTSSDLEDIHQFLKEGVTKAGGRIDAIYFCTAVDNKHPDRKPNPGMAYRAARDIPGVDLSKSMILGNKPSDMLFGRFAGIYTVFIATTNPETPFPHPDIDLRFNSLPEFAKAL